MATKKKILTSNLQAVAEIAAQHEPGQPLPEDQAEKAASGSGYQGEEITDAELEASKPKLQIVRKDSKGEEISVSEKPAEKQVQSKQQKPKVEKPKRETGVSKVTAEVVLRIFELAKSGKSNAEIAIVIAIPVSYVGAILSAHVSWVKHTEEQFAALGKSYPEKFVRSKPEKPAVKKEAEVKA